MKFKNLYKAKVLDPERVERMKHGSIEGFEILYLASDFENAFEQAKYVGYRRAAKIDKQCNYTCKDVKIMNVELVTTGVLLPE